MTRFSAAALLVLACLPTRAAAAQSTTPADKAFSPPEAFAPGVISDLVYNSAVSMTRDGSTAYFEHRDDKRVEIRMSKNVGGVWQPASVVEFSGRWRDLEPALAVDGSYIIFASARPTSPGGAPLGGRWGGKVHAGFGGNLWRVERKGAGWSEPRHLPAVINDDFAVFEPAVSANGTLYYMKPDSATGKFRLYSSSLEKGEYRTVQPLPFSDGSSTDVDAAVAPDNSYLIYCSSRGGADHLSLYITFHRGSSWSTPMLLPDVINGKASIQDAHVSPDESTLVFSHDQQVFSTPLAPILAWARAKDPASAQ